MRRMMSLMIVMVSVLAGTHHATAKDAEQDILARYERAAYIQKYRQEQFVANANVTPYWSKDSSYFWYKRETGEGLAYVIYDVARKSTKDAFNHKRLASALSKKLDKKITANQLMLTSFQISDDRKKVSFSAYGKAWHYSSKEGLVEQKPSENTVTMLTSPDGKKAAFFKNHNIWIKDLESGQEKALTTDGEAFYQYGQVPHATGRPVSKPEAIWSADSQKLLTIQTDDRKVKDLPVIDFAPVGSVRPVVKSYLTALPGDENIPTYRMTSFDVQTGKQTAAHYPPLASLRMLDTPIGGNRAWWSQDNKTVYFVDIERGEKTARVVKFDTETGSTRSVFAENTDTYLELGSNVYTPTSLRYLPQRNQLIWYSERTGWAHLYLYDLTTGKMIRPLTRGDWLVRDVLEVNEENGELFLNIAGRVEGRDPYYQEVARVNLDTGKMTVLSSSDADHEVASKNDFAAMIGTFLEGMDISQYGGMSPNGQYYVETVARPDKLSTTYLRDRNGKEISVVERADGSRLPEGWIWPEPFQLLAADGKTTISGVMFKPMDFDANQKYPVLDYIYGGPQVSNVPENYGQTSYMEALTTAQLGFITVVIDGRGTTERSRAFHEASHGKLETASNVEDHIAVIKQLAEKYAFMDLDRVGIYGFSGGGYMTASAILRFPDFFKVAVSGAGNHDQRLFWHGWGERYQGMLDGDNYLSQANLTYAKNLKGKLLFIHGMLDHGVHPGALFQLTQALMDANRDFDLVILPRAGHELPGYAMRRQWDYFVEHLAGITPPEQFKLENSGDLLAKQIKEVMSSSLSEKEEK